MPGFRAPKHYGIVGKNHSILKRALEKYCNILLCIKRILYIQNRDIYRTNNQRYIQK